MHILIFKTNITSRRKVKEVSPRMNHHPLIADWSIDLEDIDNVLRIEAKNTLVEKEVISLIEGCGYVCEELPD
ncbi:MAG: hypothetical protein AAF587_42315 [Bacteroidota bacterium]